ncbi:unnamed protein product [Mucor circinelloides]|uniref:BZIP domain-containing protein n=1 Tax=Mucor circinelloides f. circinelloides (strain 1006PhL) TaxID=1220926 RepID=S2JJ55_MUCC1|nr:hypothetical protein HMPREF1544_04650 [Mucor circinelloides 1006PhL]
MNTSNTTSNNNLDLINLDSLDDWLESDLRQSGIILPAKPNDKPMTPVTPAQILMASPPISECTPRMDPLLELSTPKIKYEPLSPMETPKIEPQDICNNTRTSIDIQPFIKALSLLSSIQHLDKQQKTQQPQQPQAQQTQQHKRQRSESIDEDQPQDLVALKRQRNTDAARRSRQRKAMKMDSLEKRVMDLEAENERLRLRAAVAESERANIEAKEKRSRVRILELERQLADTHRSLLRHNNKDSTTAMAVKV